MPTWTSTSTWTTATRPTSSPASAAAVDVRAAHDFVWKHARRPYDLTVLSTRRRVHPTPTCGGVRRALSRPRRPARRRAPSRPPRAEGRCAARREYRAELRYDRPEFHDGVEGIAAPRPVPPSARPLASAAPGSGDGAPHRGARPGARRTSCGDAHPGRRIDVLRFGVGDPGWSPPAGDASGVVFTASRIRPVVGRIEAVLRALRRVRRETPATLCILGPLEDGTGLASAVAAAGLDADAVTVAEPTFGTAAVTVPPPRADVCICLPHRSGGSDRHVDALPGRRARDHRPARGGRLADLPLLDASSWRNLHGSPDDGVAVGVDPRREAETLWLAMRRLAVDGDPAAGARRPGPRLVAGAARRGGRHARRLPPSDPRRRARAGAAGRGTCRHTSGPTAWNWPGGSPTNVASMSALSAWHGQERPEAAHGRLRLRGPPCSRER